MYQYQEPEATQWDVDSERYAATIRDMESFNMSEEYGASHDVHDQDGLFRCCGMTDEDRAEEAARMAREEAEERAYAAAIAAGDLPF